MNIIEPSMKEIVAYGGPGTTSISASHIICFMGSIWRWRRMDMRCDGVVIFIIFVLIFYSRVALEIALHAPRFAASKRTLRSPGR